MDRYGGLNPNQIDQMFEALRRRYAPKPSPRPQPLRRMPTIQLDLLNRLPAFDRPQMQVNIPGTGSEMALNGTPQCMTTENSFMQCPPVCPRPVPQSNSPNKNRICNGNCVASSSPRHMPLDSRDYVSGEFFDEIDLLALDDTYDQPRPATGQNAPAQNAPQNGHSNDPPPPTSSSVDAGADADIGQSASMQCAICLDDMNSQNISSTPCGHLFCTSCIIQAIRNDRCCPVCQNRVALNDLLHLYFPPELMQPDS